MERFFIIKIKRRKDEIPGKVIKTISEDKTGEQ